MKPQPPSKYPTTPDGRYFVVRGQLWRCTNPHLSPRERELFTKQLMIARRDVKAAKQRKHPDAEHRAHRKVDQTKQALGERGEPWWTDGAPDYNRHKIENTPYAKWWDLRK